MLGIIIPNFGTISDEIFVLLYKSLVRPHLEYANVVCSPCMQLILKESKKVQKTATKLIANNQAIIYGQATRFPALIYRRHRGDRSQIFKIMHSSYNVDSTLHFILSHNVLTCEHRFKLFHKHMNYDLRKSFFVVKWIVSLWNSRPLSRAADRFSAG
jgi:ribonuclease P/MRP protein subunit RPP40